MCIASLKSMTHAIKAKNALVIPQVIQGIFKNFCTKHPVSKYHIPIATSAIKINNKTL
jgi:hypothetical protein